MRKLTYLINEADTSYEMEFITDRTPQWTESQYMRHRINTVMKLISDEKTKEKKPISRKVELG